MTMKTATTPAPVDKKRRMVGITEAATYLGVSRWTLYEWMNNGKIPVHKYPQGRGRSPIRKIDLDDCDRFIARSREREREK